MKSLQNIENLDEKNLKNRVIFIQISVIMYLCKNHKIIAFAGVPKYDKEDNLWIRKKQKKHCDRLHRKKT